MPKLSDLGLTNEQVGASVNYETMPDQFGTFTPPPEPGDYRFRFPANLSDCWELFDHPNGNPPGKRLRARFDDAHPLLIVQSPKGLHNGEPFNTSISNAEFRRGKKDDPTAQYGSDMDYLFRDVWGLPVKPPTNPASATEFIKHAGTEFTAEVVWSWKCDVKKPIYVDNGAGGLTEVPNQMGCGTTYRQRDVPKEPSDPKDPASPSTYPLRITCQCGGNIRVFANLQNYRA